MKVLGVSTANLQVVAFAGVGAVVGSYVQTMIPPSVKPLWRDLGIGVVAAVAAAKGGESLRPVALGVGAVAIGSIISSFLVTGSVSA